MQMQIGGRRAYRMHVLLAVLVGLVTTAGCASAPTEQPSPARQGEARATEAAGGGFRIVAYGGEDVLGGREIAFDTLLRRGKPVVLNFWAGLCPPCRAEMPAFQRVYDEHGDSVIFVGVDVGVFTGLGNRAAGQRLLRELRISYPTGYALSSAALAEYRIVTMPTTVFFGRDGREDARHGGFLTEDELRARIAALLVHP